MIYPNIKWQKSIIDELIQEFPEEFIYISPKHPAWKDRIKFEIDKIIKYVNFLRNTQNEAWFRLYPEKTPRFNYQVWTGFLMVPNRPEIKFEIKVILSAEYPKVSPRCFIEESILNYCGKVFVKKTWKQDGRKYVEICHEHLFKANAWNPRLGIVHFFMRQIWVWWAAQQNIIIQEFDAKYIKSKN
ncbi:MAG: hypothetical protein ACTSVV_18495 [Promethearchaeota archaeon]